MLNFTHGDVARGHVTYYPLPPATGTGNAAILEDSFQFVLTASNAQPVAESLVIELIPLDYRPPSDSALGDPSTPSGAAAEPEVVEEPAVTSQDGGGGADKVQMLAMLSKYRCCM